MTEWRLVPVEPTPEMDKAGADTFGGQGDSADARYECAVMYRAMIAAAPQPPAAQEPVAWVSANHQYMTMNQADARAHILNGVPLKPLYLHPAPADDRVRELTEALQMLHDDCVEYLTINNLGGYDNHVLRRARAALANGGK